MANTLGSEGTGNTLAGALAHQAYINVTAAPTTSPGVASAVGTIAYDTVNAVYYVKTGTSSTAWQAITGTNRLPKVSMYAGTTGVSGATATGTHTLQSWTNVFQVFAIGQGGGGGSGARGRAGWAAYGGGGGAGGSVSFVTFSAAQFAGATLTYSASQGGTPGASVTVDDTAGNNGGQADNTNVRVTAGIQLVYAGIGGKGFGAPTPAASPGTPTGSGVNPGMFSGGTGSSSSISANAANGNSGTAISGAGGGAGGGISAADVAYAGGNGGTNMLNYGYTGNSGAVNTDGGAPLTGPYGTAAAIDRYLLQGAGGCGGGGASTTQAAGRGGDASNYDFGAGGGGGGASRNGFASGRGGYGGPGAVLFVEW